MKICILSVLLFLSFASYADITVTEESSGSVLTTYFSNNIMAHYIDGQITNITDIKNQKIFVMNPMKKTYFQATFAEMKKIAVPKGLSGNGQKKVNVSVIKLGTKKIAGYTCEEHQLVIDELYTEANVCFSKDLLMQIRKEVDAAEAEKLMNEMDMDGAQDPLGAKIASMKYSTGYVMEQSAEGGVPGFDTMVTDVSKEKLNKSIFKVPAGYRMIHMEEALGTY